jgi:hypothetical protein
MCVAVLWVAALLAAEIWRHVWAWVDDQDELTENLIIHWLRKYSAYKYPIYHDGKIKSYVRDAEYVGMRWSAIPIEADGKPYVAVLNIILISSVSPMLLLLGYKFYHVALAIIILVIVARIARFTRRLNKKYTSHVNNEEVHNKPVE